MDEVCVLLQNNEDPSVRREILKAEILKIIYGTSRKAIFAPRLRPIKHPSGNSKMCIFCNLYLIQPICQEVILLTNQE